MVMGFFAGFSITVLVVIMQSPTTFRVPEGFLSGEEYFQILISVISSVSVVCIFSLLSAMEVAGGNAQRGSNLDRFGYICFMIGLFGLVVTVPLLLIPYSEAGALIVFVLELILLFMYFVSDTKSAQSDPRYPK